jgi:hypothetical protein
MTRCLLLWVSLSSATAFTAHRMDGRVLTLLEAHRKPLEPSMVSKSAVRCALAGVLCVGIVSGGSNIQPAMATSSQSVHETQLLVGISRNEELMTTLKAEIKAEIKAELKAESRAEQKETARRVAPPLFTCIVCWTYGFFAYLRFVFSEQIMVATAGIDPRLKSFFYHYYWI